MESLFDLFRSNLKIIRQDRDLSQEDLSEACNYDPSYIGKIERGSNHPSLEVLFRLARALRVRIADFFVQTEESSENPTPVPSYPYRSTDSRESPSDSAEKLASLIFQAAHHVIVLLDDAGEILRANPAAEKWFDRTESRLRGNRLWELMVWSETQADRLKKGIHKSLAGEFQELTLTMSSTSEDPISVTLTLTPVIEQGKAVDFIVVEAVFDEL